MEQTIHSITTEIELEGRRTVVLARYSIRTPDNRVTLHQVLDGPTDAVNWIGLLNRKKITDQIRQKHNLPTTKLNSQPPTVESREADRLSGTKA